MVVSPRIQLQAQANFSALSDNLYPGRGFVIGLAPSGSEIIQVYFITARSLPNRNRLLSQAGDRVFTEFADREAAKGQDPSLIIYNAMRDVPSAMGRPIAIVSNGVQTDAVVRGYLQGTSSLEQTMEHFVYEDDPPNFTPRITGVAMWKNLIGSVSSPVAAISIVQRSPFSAECDRSVHDLSLAPGFGCCVHTYMGDGNPLPSFEGAPYYVHLGADLTHTAEMFWNILNPDYRVALVAKAIPRDGGPTRVVIYNEFSPKR